jgi:hypothetical protein
MVQVFSLSQMDELHPSFDLSFMNVIQLQFFFHNIKDEFNIIHFHP